jgi:hypothetical protein
MIWTEQKKEDVYTYFTEDFFGDLTITTKTKLGKYELDAVQGAIEKGGSGETDFTLKTKEGIIELHYKFNKNTKPLWEKEKQN